MTVRLLFYTYINIYTLTAVLRRLPVRLLTRSFDHILMFRTHSLIAPLSGAGKRLLTNV